MPGYIDSLKEMIRRKHNCEVEHAVSEPVAEEFRGQTLWAGHVEIFDLRGHAEAKRCYAWTHTEQGESEPEYLIVLELPPIDSARAAVRAALLREVQEEKQKRQIVTNARGN